MATSPSVVLAVMLAAVAGCKDNKEPAPSPAPAPVRTVADAATPDAAAADAALPKVASEWSHCTEIALPDFSSIPYESVAIAKQLINAIIANDVAPVATVLAEHIAIGDTRLSRDEMIARLVRDGPQKVFGFAPKQSVDEATRTKRCVWQPMVLKSDRVEIYTENPVEFGDITSVRLNEIGGDWRIDEVLKHEYAPP